MDFIDDDVCEMAKMLSLNQALEKYAGGAVKDSRVLGKIRSSIEPNLRIH